MEYKFRGKSKRTNEWVYGSYHCCNRAGAMRFVNYKDGNRVVEDKLVTFNSHWILVHQTPDTVGWDIRDTFIPHEVYPESVGMWTGLKDSNGDDIYRGHIVNDRIQDCVVQWIEREAKFHLSIINNDEVSSIRQTHKQMPLDAMNLTIIGDIHDKV